MKICGLVLQKQRRGLIQLGAKFVDDMSA